MVPCVEVARAGAAAEVNLPKREVLLAASGQITTAISLLTSLVGAPDELGCGWRARHGLRNRDVSTKAVIRKLRVVASSRIG